MGPSTADDVAKGLDTDPDSTARILGALVALDLLEHDGELFGNGVAAREFLQPDEPESMTTWMTLISTWNQTFANLAESVRTGKPAEIPEEHLGGSEEYTRHFIMGMHDYAMGPGRELARHLDIEGRQRLLDVGGGPGTYSILLAEAHPELRATVYDLPDVVNIAGEVIERHGLTDRVDTTPGDYHTDTFPTGYDAVLISNTLHQEDWDTCVNILKKAREALDPGGLVIVHAMFLNEQGDGPLWPALHNLLMLLVYRGGRAYSLEQTYKMLEEAGFQDPQVGRMSLFNAGSFVTAHRP